MNFIFKMQHVLIALFFLTSFSTFSQTHAEKEQSIKNLDNAFAVKSNLLSLIAARPTVSVEKFFPNRISAELCFVQGQFNNIVYTDHYNYSGWLVRIKKYAYDHSTARLNPLLGAYAGNLKRNIVTEEASIGGSSWLSYPSRNFSANSIRAGGTAGISFITKKGVVVEGLSSLGYGCYVNLDHADPNTYMNGYLDMQIWLSVGYCF